MTYMTRALCLTCLFLLACQSSTELQNSVDAQAIQTQTEALDEYKKQRGEMVEQQIKARGIRDGKVLDAMRTVPRHRFVPEGLLSRAYIDSPLPIGLSQTISQPYIVAYMTEAADISKNDKVLEIGT